MATITDNINTTILEKVQSERIKKDSGVTPLPVPDQDSSEVVLSPLTGPIAYFTIKGNVTGTLTEAQTFINKLNYWVTIGGKLSTENVSFIGDVNPGPFSVRVIAADWEVSTDGPYVVKYNIQMIQGKFAGA